jgi:hypothetical protein
MYEEIREVYDAFATYPKPQVLEACDHCWSETHKQDLLSCRLEELTPEQLRKYAFDAFFTIGDVADFKYFLPRIFEITVSDDAWYVDPEVVLAKLQLAEWSNWPQNERVAVESLLNKKFATLIKDPDAEGPDIDKWICALGRCVADISPYLELLLKEASEEKLLSFMEWNQTALTEGKLANAFWDSSANERRLLDWIKSQPVKASLKENY